MQLVKVLNWLCANKLSLNIEKSNYIIFHLVQKKLNYEVKVILNGHLLKQEFRTSYLGVVIDSHLNWKAHVSFISKKVKRNVGAISKIRNFVSTNVLINFITPLFTHF